MPLGHARHGAEMMTLMRIRKDVIALYDKVHIGMQATITQKCVADIVSSDKASLLARSD